MTRNGRCGGWPRRHQRCAGIDAFARAIKAKLSNKDLAKRYLHALVDEITVSGNTATMKGSCAALTSAIEAKKWALPKKCPI